MKRTIFTLIAFTIATLNLTANEFVYDQSQSDFYAGSSAYAPCQPQCGQPQCGSVFIEADWIYWKAEQQRLDFAYVDQEVDVIDVSQVTPAAIDREILTPKFSYQSGFKAALGYQGPCNNFQIAVIGTHLPSKASICHDPDVITAEENVYILDPELFLLRDLEGFPLTTARGKWHLNYSSVDLDFGFRCTPCSCVSLFPHFGLRTTWLEEKYTISGENLRTSTPLSNIAFVGCLKNDFVGVGIETGVRSQIDLGCGFAFLLDVSGSLLYARQKVHGSSEIIPLNSDVEIEDFFNVDYRVTRRGAVPTLEYFAGVIFNYSLYGTEIGFKAGWEEHILFDTNQFTISEGNLSFSGLTLGLDVSF